LRWDELTEKRSEDLAGSKRDGRKGKTTLDRPDIARVNDRPDIARVNDRPDIARVNDRPDIACVNDRPDMVRVNDRPDILHTTDGTDAPESEKGLESKQVKTVRDEPRDLQAQRGGLKVKDSDFKTK
jgi:hypothetical protein